MERSMLVLIVLLLTLPWSQAQSTFAAWQNAATPVRGDGTYYGLGEDYQASCKYNGGDFGANTMKLPWTAGMHSGIALNKAQWAGSASCGMCIMYRWWDKAQSAASGAGTTPPPTSWTLGFVNNVCPECSPGDIDQAINGDGRWGVEWYAVPCMAAMGTPLHVTVTVETPYYTQFVVSNHVVPITGVEIKWGGGDWVPLVRKVADNQWPYYTQGSMPTYPLQIRITSVLGETVEDIVPAKGGYVTGGSQFNPAFGGNSFTLPGGNYTATRAANTTAGSTVTATSQPPTPSAQPAATPQPTNAPTPAATAQPTADAGSATPTPTAAAAVPASTSTPAATSTAAPGTTPAPATSQEVAVTTTPAATAGATTQAPITWQLKEYDQCGGNGYQCQGVFCMDAQWPGAVCPTSAAGQFKCVRVSAANWQCRIDGGGSAGRRMLRAR